MTKFYTNVLTLTITMVALTGAITYFGLSLSKIKTPLMPRESSKLHWRPSIEPDKPDGKTTLNVKSEGLLIEYDFFLSSEKKYPYTGYNVDFVDDNLQPKLVDLTGFDTIAFETSCAPRNILLLVMFTFDDRATDLSDPKTYRVNWHFFTCNHYSQKEVAPLREFETPDWWLQNTGLELVDRAYHLDKVIGFAFINSLQSPRDTRSTARISELTLTGTNWIYIFASVAMCFAMWVGFTYWALHQYINKLVEKAKARMQEDLPLIAYQKLSLAPQKDKPKSDLLLYLATEYPNPDLSIELVGNTLGLNRNKINEILKEELGLTFTGYVNKLRLTEAARLLCLHEEETIAQIAYQVGFNNVTYFNKLFKQTYGCSPKRFKEGVNDSSSENSLN